MDATSTQEVRRMARDQQLFFTRNRNQEMDSEVDSGTHQLEIILRKDDQAMWKDQEVNTPMISLSCRLT